MRKITFFLFFVVLSLLGLVGCEFSASTANIQSTSLSRDKAGTQTTTVFDPADTFYSIVNLANAPDDTKVKAVWTAVNVGDAAAPNYLLAQKLAAKGAQP